MVKLKLNRDVFNDAFYPLMFDYSHRWEVYMGSAGSSKSYSITQKLIIRATREKIRILVCRRYGTTLRNTVFALFKEVLQQWQLTPYIKINESDFRIRFPNGSEIMFIGLDEETKLLSLTNIGTVWIEEAYEVPQSIVDQLNLRMRGKNEGQQIIMSFNPISSNSWLYEFVNNPPESFIFHHSTYKDNRFLSKDYVNALEEMRERNPQKARIYCDGEWGIDTDGLVLTNWTQEEFDEKELIKKLGPSSHRVGMDFGWLDPSAIIASIYDEKSKTIYVYDEVYGPGKTLDELYADILDHGFRRSKIMADSAEPRTIDYFKKQGINMLPCIKGQNSVDARITFLQNHKIVIKQGCCPNFLREISNFSYEKDRQSGKFMEGKYTHEFSHSIDALGYAYSDIYTKTKLRTLDKNILGI